MVLFGSSGTFDWNADPQGRQLENLNSWPDGLKHAHQQNAVEYPVGSLKFVICGGADDVTDFLGAWPTTENCKQLSSEFVHVFQRSNELHKIYCAYILFFRFSLLDNLWTNFASLVMSCSDGVLKVVGGMLFSFGGIHRTTQG